MAIFTETNINVVDQSGAIRESLDWSLSKAGPVSLFRSQTILEDAVAWFVEHDYAVAAADCGVDTSKRGILTAVLRALKASREESNNLDAFADLLRDVEVSQDSGLVIVLRHFDKLVRADRQLAENLLDIIAQSAWDNLLFGQRLLCLVQSDDPDIQLPPVGGHSPWWNPREWLQADRNGG